MRTLLPYLIGSTAMAVDSILCWALHLDAAEAACFSAVFGAITFVIIEIVGNRP